MSLTSIFSTDSAVKAKLSELFPKPKWKMNKELAAPPLTKNYSLIGTAFDYLLRFHVHHFNRSKISHLEKWVANTSHKKLLDYIESKALLTTHLGAGMNGEKAYEVTELKKLLKDQFEKTKLQHQKFIESGKISKSLAKQALFLAKMDNYFRSGVIDPRLEGNLEEDIEDLLNLCSLIDRNQFTASTKCFLNPTFGEGSILVGGADADIVLDGLLIDIKTTKSHTFERDYFNQLIGYYTIAEIGGVGHKTEPNFIDKLGIYFSRHGVLWSISVDEIAEKAAFEEFKNWLIEHLKKEK